MMAGNRQHTCDSSVKPIKNTCKWKYRAVCPNTCKYSLYVVCLWQPCGLTFCTSRGLLLTEWCHDAKNCRESLLIYYSLTERTPHPHLRADRLLTSHPKSTPPLPVQQGACVGCVWEVRTEEEPAATPVWLSPSFSIWEKHLDKHLCHLDSMRSWSQTTVAPPGKALKNQRR